MDTEYQTDRIQKWPNNLLVVRHGQSRRNVARELAKQHGQHADFSEGIRDQDTPLTTYGHLQGRAVGIELRKDFPPRSPLWTPPTEAGQWSGTGAPLDVIFLSPYLRTRQTTDAIVEGLGYTPPCIVDERIREIEFGLLDGLDRRGIEVKYPEEVTRRAREGKYYYRPPGGESRPDVKLRARSVLDTLVRDWAETNVLLVCHSVVVLAIRAVLERWQEDQYLEIDKENDVKNCGILHYKFDRDLWKLKVHCYNRMCFEDEAVKGTR